MLKIEWPNLTVTCPMVFRRLMQYCSVLQENSSLDYRMVFERVDVGVTLCRSSATTKSIW